MLTYELPNTKSQYRSLSLWVALQAAWRAYYGVRCLRRELRCLSLMSPRLIRDIGFNPEQVYRVLDGTWDELMPNIQDYRLIS